MNPIRVLLADDHGVVRAGLRALIDSQADMQVVGEAADGVEALRQTAELQPDVAILDLSMPELNGIQAAERIRHQIPAVKVLILTIHEEGGQVEQVLRSGACGYVPKRAAANELIEAIHLVARGGVYLDPAGAQALAGLQENGSPDKKPARPLLSEREEAVLRLLATGFSTKEVASRLGVSVKTVETHKARSMDKLGFHSRVDIVRYALHHGWLEDV